MGKVGFTKLQRTLFDYFVKQPIAKKFYFTGGTALSVFYLQHRLSEDLDFFSEKDFDNDELFPIFAQISNKIGAPSKFTQKVTTRIFEFVKGGKLLIKIDFVHHPYLRIDKGTVFGNIEIDSLRDIGANKLLCLNQRTDVKDYVDLYFLLKKFTMWDMMYAVEAKYRMKLDLVLIAADFLKVEEFDLMPKMLKPLSLAQLKTFYRNEAKKIGKTITRR